MCSHTMGKFLCLILLLNLACMCFSARDEKFFKVPIDPSVRMQDRPQRLTDDRTDPKMVKLREVQDRIFAIINEETAADFQGVSQLLQIVDSDAGKEIGQLAMSGAMLALGSGKSYQLYEEFIDDFKYRGPLGLSEAFHDYADFMKGVDISMIPMTMEVLFKKDHLGNSLAQMPLGQLVDLVQPEASKYGIDIRGMIDGILGKGDSKFPELLRKALYSFNMTNIMNSVMGTVEDTGGLQTKEKVPNASFQNNIGQLFKPMIAKLLKENNIDLEPDAVAQVLNPFINAVGTMASNPKQLAPILAGLTGLMSSGGGGLDLPSMMNMASQFMGKGPKSKNSKSNDGPEVLDMLGSLLGGYGDKFDPQTLLVTASQLLGQKGGAGGLDIMNIMSMFNQNSGNMDAAKILDSAMKFIDSTNKPDRSKQPEQPKQPQQPKQSQQTKYKKTPERESDLIDALETSVNKMRTDSSLKSKMSEGWTYFKSLLKAKNINFEKLDTLIPSLIMLATGGSDVPGGINTGVLTAMLTSSEEDWRETLHNLENDDLRETVVNSATGACTEIIEMITQEQFIKRAYSNINSKLQETLQSFGMMGVTIDNFPDKLAMPIGMMLIPFNVKIDVRDQLVSMKASLKDLMKWIDVSVRTLRQIPKHKMESEVAKALDKDVLSALVSAWKTYDRTSSNSKCFIKNTCERISEIEEASSHISLHNLMTRTFGVGLGLGRSYTEENLDLALGILKVCFRSEHDCQVDFPYKCPSAADEKPKAAQNEMNLQYDDHKDEL